MFSYAYSYSRGWSFALRAFLLAAMALSLTAGLVGCSNERTKEIADNQYEPKFFRLIGSESERAIVTVSPFDGTADTLWLDRPVNRLVVMSTSHAGFLKAIGSDSLIVGISGADYVCDPQVRERIGRGEIREVGYEAAPDYETILQLKPDLVLMYAVSPAKSRFASKLQSLGIPVLYIHEHLESHPLSRAAYVRLFGALAGKEREADSVYASISEAYLLERERIDSLRQGRPSVKILVNIPYNDQWYIPGGDNYLSHLVRDAGGEILGSEPSRSESGIISLEEAYSLSKEAELWLNPGWCTTLDQLRRENPLFDGILENIRANAKARMTEAAEYEPAVVYNNNRRLNAKGGNDFWESGLVRPEILLKDLEIIFCQYFASPQSTDNKELPQPDHRRAAQDSLTYFVQLR